ncbi:uncharacterized protein [Rutidosis leptorrhynchoides]|uniref:uncharacterized protein n=1 Tax=Rutidosis leptorrhynchoides TaxID=125765 RepID=UPI003A995619
MRRKPNKKSKESIKAPPKKCCKICENTESKYKCPTCFIPYCSLTCFKKHKENPCIKPAPENENDTSAPILPIDVDRPCYIDNFDDVLPQSQLESIATSTEILEALKDKELQKIICNIDCSANAETELDKAMEQEVFRLFTEKILSRVTEFGK